VIGITDEELAAEALAADPDVVLADDAEAFGVGGDDRALLPSWYMPAPASYRWTPARRVGIVVVLASLLIVNAAGLCVTYGVPEIAW
jgi:hypothetical protein